MEEPKQADIWWANLPEPLGRRPVLVLTRNAAIPVRTNVSVALLTRTIRGIDSEVELGVRHGVKTRCAVSLDNIVTIPKPMLDRRMTA